MSKPAATPAARAVPLGLVAGLTGAVVHLVLAWGLSRAARHAEEHEGS